MTGPAYNLSSTVSDLRQEASAETLQLVEFPLEGGGSVLVEVDELLAGGNAASPATRGLREPAELTVKASETLDAALARVQPAAVAVIGRLRSLVDPPDEVEIQFGIQLTAEFGAVVAKTGGSANFEIRMRWNSSPS